jgi:hypothetical protein
MAEEKLTPEEVDKALTDAGATMADESVYDGATEFRVRVPQEPSGDQLSEEHRQVFDRVAPADAEAFKAALQEAGLEVPSDEAIAAEFEFRKTPDEADDFMNKMFALDREESGGQLEEAGEEFGEFEPKEAIPPEKWIPHPVSDSAEYLDREPPRYVSEEDSE